MSEIIAIAGGQFPTPTCHAAEHGTMLFTGARPARYAFRCGVCGSRVLVCTSSSAPPIYAWKKDCPPEKDFYDYVRSLMGENAQAYEPTRAGVHAPSTMVAATA